MSDVAKLWLLKNLRTELLKILFDWTVMVVVVVAVVLAVVVVMELKYFLLKLYVSLSSRVWSVELYLLFGSYVP